MSTSKPSRRISPQHSKFSCYSNIEKRIITNKFDLFYFEFFLLSLSYIHINKNNDINKKKLWKKRRKIFIPSQGPCDPCSNNKKLKGCCKDHEGSLKHKHRDSMTEDMVLLRLKNVWFE